MFSLDPTQNQNIYSWISWQSMWDFTYGFLSSTSSLEFSQILICYILHKPRVSKTTNISLDWALIVSY